MRVPFFEKTIQRRLAASPNRSAIQLCVHNEMELYDYFSAIGCDDDGPKKINGAIMEYLERETEKLPIKDAMTIVIRKPGEISAGIEVIEKLIKDALREKLDGLNCRLKGTNRISAILSFIGMYLIAFTQLFPILKQRPSLNEFVVVMSWVFMWKAVELFFFERAKMIKQRNILLKLYFSELTAP